MAIDKNKTTKISYFEIHEFLEQCDDLTKNILDNIKTLEEALDITKKTVIEFYTKAGHFGLSKVAQMIREAQDGETE